MKKPLTTAEIHAELKQLKAIKIDYSKFKPTQKQKNDAFLWTIIVEVAIFMFLGLVCSQTHVGVASLIPIIAVFLAAKPVYRSLLNAKYIPENSREKAIVLRRRALQRALQSKHSSDDIFASSRDLGSINCTYGFNNPISPNYIGKKHD